MKRILTTILSVIMLFCVSMFVLTACDGCGEKITEKPQEQVEAYVNLSLAEKQLIVGDEALLVATTPLIDGLSVAWTSSDTNVATVSGDGIVTAMRPGTADITATFGDKTAKCIVTVSLGSNLPHIEFENQIVNDTVNIAKNSDINLGAFVKFNGKTFNDATFTYNVIEGNSLGSVTSAGKFSAGNEKGQILVEVKASWRGIDSPELTKIITVNVIASNAILIDQGKTSTLTLYTVAQHGGNEFNITQSLEGRITAFEDDIDRTSEVSYRIIKNLAGFMENNQRPAAASYDDSTKTITALNFGTAVLELSFESTDGPFVVEYPINVIRPVAEYSDTMEMFSILDGEAKGPNAISYNTVFGADVTLLEAYQGGDEFNGTSLTVSENKVLGFRTENYKSFTEDVITVYDKQVGYTIRVEACAKVVEQYSDLAVFHGQKDVQGYVVLINDLEYDDSLNGLSTVVKFTGVFEGNGHYINAKTIKGGLFGTIDGATIQNVALLFTAKGAGEDRYLVGSSSSKSSVIKDVLIDVDIKYLSGTNYSLFGQSSLTTSDFRNVIVDFAPGTLSFSFTPATTHKYGGGFEDYTNAGNFTKKDTDFNGDGTSDYSFNADTFENVYYINSDYKIAGWYNGNTAGVLAGVYFAENDGAVCDEVKDTLPVTEKFAFFKGLKRYDNYGKMLNAANDYSSFNTDVWDLSEGLPKFKSVSYPTEIQVETTLDLTVGVKETATLSAFLFGSTEAPVYACATSDVVTVDATTGVVTAVGVGTADITVTIGSKTATCTVTVGWKDGVAPELSVDGLSDAEPVYINYNGTKEFTARLTYNGAEIDGLTFNWSSAIGGTFADATVGSFVAPNNYASGDLRVTVTYYGETFYLDFPVLVATDPEMKVNGAEPTDIELYTNATWGGSYVTEVAFVPTTEVAGVEVTNIATEDDTVAIYEDGKVKSVGVGETYVIVTFVDSQDQVITRKVKVTVIESIKEIADVLDYSAIDGKIIGIEAYFEEQGEVVIDRASLDGTALTVEAGNVITGINGDSNEVQTIELIVGAGTKSIKLNVNVYKMVIDEDDDFKVFEGVKNMTGYFKVANDIVLDSWTGNVNQTGGTGRSSFDGVFDGNGHTVEVALKTWGIFGVTNSATIKNTAFIVKQVGDRNYAYASILANQMNASKVIDCYFEYDLPESIVFDVNYSGYGQSVGLGVYNTPGNLTKFYNVIINTSKVQIKNAETAFAYGSLMSKASNNKSGGTGSGTWQTVTSDVYVISNYKYLSYSVDSTPTPGSTSGALTGITNISAVWFAENEVELYNAQKDIDGSELSDTVKKIIEGTKRYDSFSDFANAASQNDYASFSTDLWDLSGGFPIFKSALTRFDFYYLGGSATATSAKLSSEGEGESITINANIRGVSYVPTLSIVSGTEFVTIQGNDVKAVPNAFGQAVVKATYNIAGSLVEKEYTINVIGEAWSGNAIRYSTLDSKFFFDAELEQAGVVSVVDANTSAVYYEDGFATAEIDAIANTSGTDLNDYTSNAIITLEDGTQYAIDIVSYTKILTKSSDFALFHSTSGATISGYYIMNNDIMLDGSWNGNSSQSAGVGKVKFTGVFDGNGYVAEIALDSFGVFGVVDGGTIKNTAFIVKSIGNKDFAYATILAQSLTNTTVSDCYFEYDLPAGTTVDYSYYGYGHSAGIGLYNASGVSVKFNNVIINTSKLVMTTGSYSQPFAYGALKSKADNSQYPAYITKTTNTYVISANKYISYYADVLAKDNAITQFLGDKYVWFAANDTDAFEAYNDQVGTIKKLISGTKRYDNETAFAADAENNDYTSFNANIWDTTKGYPVFKTLPAYQLVSDINKSAEYYIGGSNGYEVNLENTNSTGLTVYATYGGETYLPEFEVKSGANLITITENVIKPVANAMGTVELKATYDIEGVIVEKTYTISVTLEQLNGNIMFSTIDNEGAGRIYFPEDNRLDGENIKSVYDLNDSSIVYFDGEITTEIPKNTDSSDLTNYTKTVIVELEDGTIYSTKLISYTKVLTTAEDLLIFNIDDGDAEVKTPRMVEGYYILGGDIVGTAPLTFKHADMLTAWNNTTTGFAGVFDGDGHKVTVTLTGNNGGSEKTGIFGQLQAGAVIKNVAFVDCVIDRGVLLFSGSMNNTRESYVQNVYINMTTTTASTYGGSAWYSPGYINVQGVIIDNDTPASVISGGKTAAEILAGDIPTAADNGHGTLFSNTYALNDASRIKGLIVVSESPLAYGRVSSTTTTSNDTHSHRIAVGVNEGYQSGATIDCPCNTGLLKDHLQIFTISTVYHYASLLELSNNTSDITEIITNYSTDYWNIVNGYPVFKGLEDRVATDMISSTEYYLGGSKGATEVTLENKAETSINVYATFNSADYQPTLTIVEGNTVTVLGNTITVVANAVGNTVVKATYVINGITVEKLYTISVAPEERAGLISYSTLDNKFYLSDEIKNDDIVEIVEPISGDVYFANDQVTDKIPQNTNSKDLTDYTKKVVVKLADGSNYSVTAISYTMVLTTDDDFAVFKGENGSTIAGYYIMANDIKLDGSWTGNTCSDSSPHKFNGVFDGNGHVAEIALKKYGIFGTIVGAENNPAIIKDTAFIVKEIGAKTFAYASILAYRMNFATVSNCYFEYDLPEGTKIDTGYYGWGQSSGLGIYAATAVQVRFNNVIIDTSKVETECVTYEQPFSFGSIVTKADCSSSGAYLTRTADVYVISANKYMSYYADVTSSSGSVTAFNGIKYAWFASNDTEAYEACEVTGGKSTLSGTKRYDNAVAFATATGNDYTAFDSTVWDTTNGFPIFKAVYNDVYGEYVASADTYIGGSKGTEAQVEAKAGTSVDVYATFKKQNYQPTLVVKTGDDLVSVAGNVVTVKEGAGEGVATIEATFVIDGVTFTKDFTVTLVGAGLTGQVYYSTDDNQFFFTNSELASKEVTKVTDFETNTVYFENGTATADIENTTNAIDSYIRWVNVTCADGTEGKIQLISYTKVINEASDLTALINTKGTASAQETVTGYFALLGDIIVDSSYDTVDNAYSFFAGVLDGNGHTIKNLVVGANGLIGGITAGGQIKNLAITVTSASAGATGLIANKSKFTANASNAYDGSNASSVFLIDNCYFDIDFAWNGASSSLFGLAVAQAQSLNIINSVIDVATGVFTAPTTANAAVGYGVIYNNPAVGQMTSQIGDYVYFGKQNTTTKYVLFDNTYYVNNDYAFISVKLGTNANTKLAFVCENDTAAVSANASTYRVALVSGLNRYSSVSELPSTATAIRPSANA